MKQQPWLGAGFLLLAGLLALSGWMTTAVTAHGTNITYQSALTVSVSATFDDGIPMSDCQYTIFAPNDPATAWDSGACNEAGQFQFAPDTTIPGNWAVRIREAGHGEIINIPISESGVAAASVEEDPLQQVIIAIAMVWGFVGTALYFSNRNGGGKTAVAEPATD